MKTEKLRTHLEKRNLFEIKHHVQKILSERKLKVINGNHETIVNVQGKVTKERALQATLSLFFENKFNHSTGTNIKITLVNEIKRLLPHICNQAHKAYDNLWETMGKHLTIKPGNALFGDLATIIKLLLQLKSHENFRLQQLRSWFHIEFFPKSFVQVLQGIFLMDIATRKNFENNLHTINDNEFYAWCKEISLDETLIKREYCANIKLGRLQLKDSLLDSINVKMDHSFFTKGTEFNIIINQNTIISNNPKNTPITTQNSSTAPIRKNYQIVIDNPEGNPFNVLNSLKQIGIFTVTNKQQESLWQELEIICSIFHRLNKYGTFKVDKYGFAWLTHDEYKKELKLTDKEYGFLHNLFKENSKNKITPTNLIKFLHTKFVRILQSLTISINYREIIFIDGLFKSDYLNHTFMLEIVEFLNTKDYAYSIMLSEFDLLFADYIYAINGQNNYLYTKFSTNDTNKIRERIKQCYLAKIKANAPIGNYSILSNEEVYVLLTNYDQDSSEALHLSIKLLKQQSAKNNLPKAND